MREPSANSPGSDQVLRFVEAVLIFVATLFFILHFMHLKADFPNRSPWMDWSKYTDEGWYGDAAIRHFERGSWYVSGDFNPAAALPVLPFFEALVFRFTGVSLVAARALTVWVFGGILIASYLLLRRWQSAVEVDLSGTYMALPFPQHLSSEGRRRTLAPVLGVLLLAVSPFCLVFTRIAIIEPLLILLTLLAYHAASGVFELRLDAAGDATSAIRPLYVLSLGLLLPLMILTKTTAVFLVPSVAFLLWACAGYRLRPFLHAALPTAIIAVALWSAYFFFAVRPHYLTDYRYLFSANAYTGITLATTSKVLRDTFRDGLWIGKLLYPLSVSAIVIAAFHPRRFRRNPLPLALMLWALGYAAFLAYHNNLQPRYYLVLAVPLTLLVAIVWEPAIRHFQTMWHAVHSSQARSVLAVAVTLLFTAIIFLDARETLRFLRHPEYTLVQAADSVAKIVREDPSHSPLVLSISGSNISLMTGLPSICDDFGTLELADRVKQYRPGWYVAWNQIDDDKMDALTPFYHPVRVAAFPAMDDPVRNLLILYRLDPKNAAPRPRKGPQVIPRRMQTKIGQQPSVTQLEH